MKGSCHSCLSWKRCVPTNKLSWKRCAQTKVKLAQSTHTVIKYLIKNEYRAFLDRICNQWEPSLELLLLLCECGPSNAWEKNTKIIKQKMFFVMNGEGLTHHRLHNHITKNILILNWRTSTTYVSMKIKFAIKVIQQIGQFQNTSFTTGRSTMYTINCCYKNQQT
jgi:hypothetical protein